MTAARSLIRVTALVAAVAVAGTGAISASAGADVKKPKRSPAPQQAQIVGSWDATIDRGPTLPSLRSLHTFTRGGSMIEIGNDTFFRSAGHGAWRHVSGRIYATTHVFFRYSPTGTFLGTLKVSANRRVAPDGNSYTGVAINEVRDAAGNVIASGRATVTATRIQVEPIAEQPPN
jgi:hypothetical protein